jgi:RND family efflux transporter MFP subunit
MKIKRKYILLGVIVLFVVGIILLKATKQSAMAKTQQTMPVPTVKISTPRIETITATLQYTGNMMPIQQAGVYSKVSGNLEKVYVNIGDKVKQGQLLALIDTTLLVQLSNQTSATFNNAKLQYDRAKDLFSQNLGSKQDVDNSEAAMLVAKANAENAATQLSYARITAPFSGTITQRFLDAGAVVTTGNATLFTLMDLDSMRVFVNVLEKDIPSVSEGKQADITVDAYPDRHFTGNVARSGGAVDPATRTLTVEIDVANRDHALMSGMFSNVTMILNKHENTITVPKETVLGDSTSKWVFVVTESKTAHRVPVKTGAEQNNVLEILSGLSGQEKLIVVGQQFVKDGGPVNLQQ